MVQELEALIATAAKERNKPEGRKVSRAKALAMCDEIHAKAALPEAMYRVCDCGTISICLLANASLSRSLFSGDVLERQALAATIRAECHRAECGATQGHLDAAAYQYWGTG